MCSQDDFARVLELEHLRELFLSKLKQSNPKLLQDLLIFIQNSGILKTPLPLEQTVIIQKICQFCPPHESFENLQFVSKTWNHAVDTIRFEAERRTLHGVLGSKIYQENGTILNPKLTSKIINRSKSIVVQQNDSEEMFNLVKQNVKNLSIAVLFDGENKDIGPILKSSHHTLRQIGIDYYSPSCDGWKFSFPNLEILFVVVKPNFPFAEFFTRVSSGNMQSLRDIVIHFSITNESEVLQNIHQHAPGRFKFGSARFLKFLPFPMATIDFPREIIGYKKDFGENVNRFSSRLKQAMRYGSAVEILHLCLNIETSLDDYFDVFIKELKSNFFPNLKEIYLAREVDKQEFLDKDNVNAKELWTLCVNKVKNISGIEMIDLKTLIKKIEHMKEKSWFITCYM